MGHSAYILEKQDEAKQTTEIVDSNDNRQPNLPQGAGSTGGNQRRPTAGHSGFSTPRAATPRPARFGDRPLPPSETSARNENKSTHHTVLESLLNSGMPANKIEQEWQRYYQGLGDDDKHHLWRTLHGPVDDEVLVDEIPVEVGLAPPSERLEIDTGLRRQQTRENIEELGRRFHRGWQKSWQTPESMRHSRRQVIAYNLKTVLVAAGVAFAVYSVSQFTVWNELYLQPYLRPQANASQAQVIVTPGVMLVDPSPRLYIPKLATELAVDYEVPRRQGVESFDDLNTRFQVALTEAVVHYPTSSLPGQGDNVVIMGHSGGNIFSEGNQNYKFAFSRLQDLKGGDLIVANYQSRQYVYKVYEKRIVPPSAVEVLRQAPKPHSITLITCDPPGNNVNRLVVFAEQISPSPSGQTAQGQLIDLDQLAGEGAVLPGNSPSLIDSLRSPDY